MVEFISMYEKRQTYKIVDSANITLSIDSTLGYESAGRGNKVGFFCIREKTFPFSSFRFGWPVKKNYKGLFWTDKSSLSEISRVINFLHKKNYSTKKKVIHKELKNIIAFDEGNKKFLSLIKKLDI